MDKILDLSVENERRLKRLEEVEMQLIGRLKETTGRQKHAYNKLDKVVQDGYDYYMQSYEEKRSIQAAALEFPAIRTPEHASPSSIEP